MSLPQRFNVRVYGILIHEGKLLVNEEFIKGRTVVKFPGGGLEPGEGTIDCLKREWKEELNFDVENAEHFYTTDFYQPSAFDHSQIISIYYKASLKEIPERIINTEPNERTYWLLLSELNVDTFTLPIDRIVGEMLRNTINLHL